MRFQLVLTVVLILLLRVNCSSSASSSSKLQSVSKDAAQAQNVTASKQQGLNNTSPMARGCSSQSIQLTKQTLTHELEIINSYGSLWLHTLDREELMEFEKKSFGEIVKSQCADGGTSGLLINDGLPILEIETSYFRPISSQLPAAVASNRSASTSWLQQQQQQQQQHQLPSIIHPHHQSIFIKGVQGRSNDKCHLLNNEEFTYTFGLMVGPFEHHLDVMYNLPKEIRLSQPMDMKYGQVLVSVPRMFYEITIKQAANYKLIDSNCPLQVYNVTHLENSTETTGQQSPTIKPFTEIQASGLAATNQTVVLLERLFYDYTIPIVTAQLRQTLKFYLTSKTLPLSV